MLKSTPGKLIYSLGRFIQKAYGSFLRISARRNLQFCGRDFPAFVPEGRRLRAPPAAGGGCRWVWRRIGGDGQQEIGEGRRWMVRLAFTLLGSGGPRSAPDSSLSRVSPRRCPSERISQRTRDEDMNCHLQAMGNKKSIYLKVTLIQ